MTRRLLVWLSHGEGKTGSYVTNLGSTTTTPVPSKSLTLRVTTVIS